MGILEIPLINTYIKIEMSVKQVPNGKKLMKELSAFFDKNEIEGIKIKSFEIDDNCNIWLDLRGRKLSGWGDYHEKIVGIGKKYCIDHLQFSLSCYGK